MNSFEQRFLRIEERLENLEKHISTKKNIHCINESKYKPKNNELFREDVQKHSSDYSRLLAESIRNSKLSLSEICNQLEKEGLKTNKSQVSKLQNGKMPPAGDKINDALAKILEIDPIELKAAAYREKIPPEVLDRLLEQSSA